MNNHVNELVQVVNKFNQHIRRSSAHYVMSDRGLCKAPGKDNADFQKIVDEAEKQGLIRVTKTVRSTFLHI
jgi:hypothetical protein